MSTSDYRAGTAADPYMIDDDDHGIPSAEGFAVEQVSLIAQIEETGIEKFKQPLEASDY